MSDLLVPLSGPTLLTASAATQFTTDASLSTTLTSIHVCNETTSDATLTMSEGTDGAGKRLFMGYTIPANGITNLQCSIPVAKNVVIQAYSGTASALTLKIGGVTS